MSRKRKNPVEERNRPVLSPLTPSKKKMSFCTTFLRRPIAFFTYSWYNNVIMKKFALTITTFACCAALCITGAAVSLAPISAQADTATQETQSGLLLPQTYEEYLPLSAPSSAAVSTNYTAVADGNVIYVYDSHSQTYVKYEREQSGLPEYAIKKLQFCENGNLYFADNSPGANFYELQLPTMTKTRVDIACKTFVIHGTELYFANSVGSLYSYSLTEKSTPVHFDLAYSPTEPTLAFYNNELYFTDNGVSQTLYKINPHVNKNTATPIATLEPRIQHMTITAGVLACTTESRDFYAYSLAQINEEGLLTKATDGSYTTLSSFGEYVYATQTQKGLIRRYSTTDKQFTSFEIGAQSAAINRLNGATDVCLFDGILYTADSGNNRISVYETSSNSYRTPITTAFPVKRLSTDGNVLLAAGENKATLFSAADGQALQTFDRFNGEIKGAASVYGTHYLISDGYAYILAQGEDGSWTQTDVKKNCASFVSPYLLTNDLHGNLYVATGNLVYTFTQDELADTTKDGRQFLAGIPAETDKLLVDYEKNVYALKNGNLYKNGETTPFAALSQKPYVYGGEGYTPSALSFTFAADDYASTVYVLFDGTYIVWSQELDIPNLHTIDTQNVAQTVFAEESVENTTVVKTQPKSLLIRFELGNLRDGETLEDEKYFPYLSHHREEESVTALVLGATEEYNLLAVFDNTKKEYLTYLTPKANCAVLDPTEYSLPYTNEQQCSAYLTNDVRLYKFPYLSPLLTVTTLPRSGQVTLLGEINEPHYAYYKVSYTADGETYTGYVPKAFVTLFDPSAPEVTPVSKGTESATTDNVWRFAYITLGCAAIAILVDYLILRRKPGDEE